MCVYKGSLLTDNQQTTTQVTVDGLPLPMLEEPGLGEAFGWGSFSPWASQKLLAYSLMHYELETVKGLPKALAYRYALILGDLFVDQRITKLEKQWTITSEDIAAWAEQRHADIWVQVTRGHAVV